MASNPLVLSDPRMLAEFVRQSEFKAFFEKRYATPPDIAALLFKNGELIDAFKGGHFSVGGLASKLKGLVGGSTHIGMLLADLKPFDVQTAIKAVSMDSVEIAGVVTLEMQVNPDKPENILGMMHGISRVKIADKEPRGRLALAKSTVLERIKPHLADRVVEAGIGRMKAEDIRGNTGFQDKIQADIMKEVERVVGDLGIMVRAVSVEWAQNSVEVENFKKAEVERQLEAEAWKLDLLKQQLERQSDAAEFQLKTQLDLAKLTNATEDELRRMALDSEIEFVDAREEAQRRQELEALGHEIVSLREERTAKFENELAEATQLIDLTKKQAEMKTFEREIDALDQEHLNAMKKAGAITELEIAERARQQQLDSIERANRIDQQATAAEAELTIKLAKAQADIEAAEAKAKADAALAVQQQAGKMTPEQILAHNAGLSDSVATVLVEQARASGSGNDQTMAIMREMVEAATAREIRGEQQQLEAARIARDSAIGVAHGASGKGGAAPSSGASTSAAVECPKCGREIEPKAKHCVGCGHKLRN